VYKLDTTLHCGLHSENLQVNYREVGICLRSSGSRRNQLQFTASSSNSNLLFRPLKSAISQLFSAPAAFRSRGSLVSIVPNYGLDDRGSIPEQRQKIFLLASASRPAMRPTHPPVQRVPGVLSPGVKRGRGVMLTTNPHLVPRLRMSRSYTSSPPMRIHGV
jgi:hypothetical protein